MLPSQGMSDWDGQLVCPGRELTRPAACGRRWAQPGERSEAAQRPQLNPHGLSADNVPGCCVGQFHKGVPGHRRTEVALGALCRYAGTPVRLYR